MSVQVANEVYNVLTLKHKLHPVTDGVRRTLEPLGRWMTAPLNFQTARLAWRIQDRYQVRIWDALLLSSATMANCAYFLSEDLNDGQAYGRLVAINPFRHSPEDVLGRAP